MKKILIVLAIASGVALTASPAFLQTEKPQDQHEHGSKGGSMMHGGMMCPMMGSGNMGMLGGGSGGMMGGMGAMMGGGTTADPKMMGRMMQMRGEMMVKMGEVMMKHGKQMLDQNQQ